jgi:hypothetical protein
MGKLSKPALSLLHMGMHLVEEFYNLVKGMKYDCGTMSSDIPICSPKKKEKKQRFIQ